MNWSRKTKNSKAIENNSEEDEEYQYQYVMPQDSITSSIKVIENKIFFYDDVSDSSILDLNKALLEMDSKLQSTRLTLGDDAVDPIIHLHIKSDGGDIYSGIASVDFMSQLRSKVYTYVEGCVASAGTLMSIVGDKRYMGRKSYLLIHQLSGETYGKYSELQDHMYNSDKLMRFIKDHYKEYTKIPMKKLDEILKKDILLDAKECLQYGIIDEIL